jgi:hypothetical protein
MILALTGRPRAAQAMLDPRPELADSPEELAIWRTSLAAFEQASPENIARARSACFVGARASGVLAGQGVMILSGLGDVDGAFDIANGFLLSRGAIVRSTERAPKVPMPDSRINTQWLFTPPCAVIHSDPRFLPLCDAMGLVDYWRKRGVKPDFLRQRV